MNDVLLHQLALTLVPNIGPVQARTLVDHFGEPAAIFKAKKSTLELLEGIGEVRARSIKSFAGYKRAEEELNGELPASAGYPTDPTGCYAVVDSDSTTVDSGTTTPAGTSLVLLPK